jgi:hypothetical protein
MDSTTREVIQSLTNTQSMLRRSLVMERRKKRKRKKSLVLPFKNFLAKPAQWQFLLAILHVTYAQLHAHQELN